MFDDLISQVKDLTGVSSNTNTQQVSGNKFSDVNSQNFPYLANVSSWVISLPSLYDVSSNGTKTTVGMVCKYPQLAVQSSLSLDNIETKGVKREGKLVNIPSGISAGEVELQFNEDQEYTMTKYFTFWRKLVVDDKGYFGVENIYRYNIPVKVLKKVVKDPKKSESAITWTINGAYPTGDISYTYSRNAEILNLSVKFSHKGITPKFT